jgi:tripartite-type tricarboxylate transporter receptor subunit TctC
VPCGKELGIAAMDNVTWYGLFAPKALSNATAASIEQVVRHIGQDAALRQSYEKSGVLWGDVYGQAFAEMVKAETMEWAQRLKTMGLHNILQKTVDEG